MKNIIFLIAILFCFACHKDKEVIAPQPDFSGTYSGDFKAVYIPIGQTSPNYGQILAQYPISSQISVTMTGSITFSGLPNYTPLPLSTYQNSANTYAFYKSNSYYYITGYFRINQGDSIYLSYHRNDTLYEFSGLKQ